MIDPSATPTIFVVDDEACVRKALDRLLRAEGFDVATFASSADFLAVHDPLTPGCLLLDMAMPDHNGLDLQQTLLERANALPVVFLTGHADVPMCAHAMKSGAMDFLTKPVNDTELLAAIRRALAQDQLSRQTRADLDDGRRRIASLTPREREVLAQVVAGKLNKQIAADLGTAEKTIKVHRGRVMAKMQVTSVAALVHLMVRLGTSQACL